MVHRFLVAAVVVLLGAGVSFAQETVTTIELVGAIAGETAGAKGNYQAIFQAGTDQFQWRGLTVTVGAGAASSIFAGYKEVILEANPLQPTCNIYAAGLRMCTPDPLEGFLAISANGGYATLGFRGGGWGWYIYYGGFEIGGGNFSTAQAAWAAVLSNSGNFSPAYGSASGNLLATGSWGSSYNCGMYASPCPDGLPTMDDYDSWLLGVPHSTWMAEVMNGMSVTQFLGKYDVSLSGAWTDGGPGELEDDDDDGGNDWGDDFSSRCARENQEHGLNVFQYSISWAFEPCEDWPAIFSGIAAEGSEKVPFGFAGWLPDLQGGSEAESQSFIWPCAGSVVQNGAGALICTEPVEVMGFQVSAIDVRGLPFVEWWHETGRTWLWYVVLGGLLLAMWRGLMA